MAEPKKPAGPNQPSVPRILLEHAVRCYESEVATEQRNARHRNLVLTAILAAIGLGMFRIGWIRAQESTIEPSVLLWILRALIVVSAALFGHALIVLLTVPGPGTPRAMPMSGLGLASGVFDTPELVMKNVAAIAVFKATLNAYLELQERNRLDRNEIDRAQQTLVVAIVPLFLTILCYDLAAKQG